MKFRADHAQLLQHFSRHHPGLSRRWLFSRTWMNRFLQRLRWVTGGGVFPLTGGYAVELHSATPGGATGIEAVALTDSEEHTHQLLRAVIDVPLGDAVRFSVKRISETRYPGFSAPTWLVAPNWHGQSQFPFPFVAWPARDWHRAEPELHEPIVSWPFSKEHAEPELEVLPIHVVIAEYFHFLMCREADCLAPVSVHQLQDFTTIEQERWASPRASATADNIASRLRSRKIFPEVLRQVVEGRQTPYAGTVRMNLMRDWEDAHGFLSGEKRRTRHRKLFMQAASLIDSVHRSCAIQQGARQPRAQLPGRILSGPHS